jgi:hypothetical protein
MIRVADYLRIRSTNPDIEFPPALNGMLIFFQSYDDNFDSPYRVGSKQ